jgi:hypothetical protein
MELAAGGWQLNTIVQAQTGTPVTILTPQFGTNYSPRASTSGPILLPHSISGQWFDTSGIVATPLGSQGNISRNSVFGPGLATGDVSVFKTLHFTERFYYKLIRMCASAVWIDLHTALRFYEMVFRKGYCVHEFWIGVEMG